MHLYQYGCCLCGAVTLADGTWAHLAVPGLPQSVVTSQGRELTTYRVSHGYCPECFALVKAESLTARGMEAVGA